MHIKTEPDTLVGKEYDADTFNCWTFIETCLDVPTIKNISIDTAKEQIEENKPFFIERLEPVNYCLVLLGDHHIGIYKDGGVYHADRDRVKYEPIRNMRRKYKTISYYDKVD